MASIDKTRVGSYRRAARLIQTHLSAHPYLDRKYAAVARICHIFSRPAFYEISDRCNLKCEGCYYFDPGTYREGVGTRAHFDAEWDGFLEREAARNVTMPYFLGAEPALEQRRLIAAARHFRRGNLGTNGTIALDPEIPFRISISAWAADEADDARLRGGSVLRKALRLYRGDERAIVLYTVNPTTIDQVPEIARACQDHGLPLTFNLWSPTTSLLERLRSFAGNDDAFFRISRPDQSLELGSDDLMRVREALDDAIEQFPETVIYSHAYNRWSTREGPLYDIDPDTGIAKDCASRIVGSFRYYGLDLQSQAVKCCTPAMECRSCRMYSGGLSSQFTPTAEQVATAGDFTEWLDMVLTIGRIFLRPEIDPEAFVSPEGRAEAALQSEVPAQARRG